MKKHIEGSLPYLMYRYWPNLVRVELGLTCEYRGYVRYYSDFKVTSHYPQANIKKLLYNIFYELA